LKEKNKIIVGIHRGVNGFSDFIRKYEEICKYNNIKSIRLDAGEQNFWEKLKTCDLFVYNWRIEHNDKQLANTIIPIIEKQLNIKCFPDMNTSWAYDDKIREHYILNLAGFPVIKSWIFWDRPSAIKWAKTVDYPVVFKLKGGAGSFNVLLLDSSTKAIKWINRIFGKGLKTGVISPADKKGFRRKVKSVLNVLQGKDSTPFWQIDKNYAYFQKFLPENEYDTRVVVIGDRAYAFRRFNRKNDFRASGSKNSDLNPKNVDLQFVKLAFEISKKMKFQSMAYDFIYDENNKPGLIEISYTFPDRTLSKCPGYWDEQLNWVDGKFWPQYFQLMDALEKPTMKQPDFDKLLNI